MNELMTDNLLAEYETMIADLGEDVTDEKILGALVVRADWTAEGARAVVMLARKYGVFVLRNALALANAIQIEDGEAGL
jgi:hypothetical protein